MCDLGVCVFVSVCSVCSCVCFRFPYSFMIFLKNKILSFNHIVCFARHNQTNVRIVFNRRIRLRAQIKKKFFSMHLFTSHFHPELWLCFTSFLPFFFYLHSSPMMIEMFTFRLRMHVLFGITMEMYAFITKPP